MIATTATTTTTTTTTPPGPLPTPQQQQHHHHDHHHHFKYHHHRHRLPLHPDNLRDIILSVLMTALSRDYLALPGGRAFPVARKSGSPRTSVTASKTAGCFEASRYQSVSFGLQLSWAYSIGALRGNFKWAVADTSCGTMHCTVHLREHRVVRAKN